MTEFAEPWFLPLNAEAYWSPVMVSLRELLPHQHLAGYTERHQVKPRLSKIDANRDYLHINDPPR
jgi:hypothetical protein